MKNSLSQKSARSTGKNVAANKISVIIPSAPDRDFSPILENLRRIKPAGVALQVLIIKGTWPPLQRNMGIEKADGEFIFLFDDDIIIPENTFEKVAGFFGENPQIDVIGGPNLTPPKNSFLQHCFGLAHASPFTGAFTSVRYYPARNVKNTRAEQLISCNLAFRSEVLKKNPFSPDIFPNEENELLNRIRKKGHGLKYKPEFFIFHHRRKNLSSYLKQIFAWGKGRVIHTFKRPQNFNPAFLAPLFFLIYLLIYLINYPVSPDPLYSIPLAIYLLLDLIFSFQGAVRGKKPAFFFVLFGLLPLTHMAYALGSLYGLLTFWVKPKPLPAENKMHLLEINLS